MFFAFRSSYRVSSERPGVLRNLAKFTGKHLRQGLNFTKKENLAQVFFCEFCEISKNTFFTEHLWAAASLLWKRLEWSMQYSSVSHHQIKKFIPSKVSRPPIEGGISSPNCCLMLFEKLWSVIIPGFLWACH